MYVSWYKDSGLRLFSADFDLLPYFTFTQNFYVRHPVFYPEIWPVPIEEWSYLYIPVLLLMIFYFTHTHYLKKYVIGLCVVILGFTFLRINYIIETGPSQDWGLRKIVLYRLDALLYGVLLAVLVKWKEQFFVKYKRIMLIAGVFVSFIFSITGSGSTNILFNSVIFTVLPLCGALILPYFKYTSFSDTKLCRLATHVSLISYAVLLSHLYFLQFSFITFFNPKSLSSSLMLTFVYLVALAGFATLFYNYVERPVLLKRKSL